MKLLKEIYDSFLVRPVLTVYTLVLSPVFYTLLALTAATVGLINLSWQDACDFWHDNT